MKVLDITLLRDELLTIDEKERTFFLSLGHLANEVNVLTKLLYWAANTIVTNNAEDNGQFVMTLLLVRMLAGTLNEAWVFLHRKFYGSALSRTYEPGLSDEGKSALKSIHRYFTRQNAANLIRDEFAFHYSPDKVAAALPLTDEYLHAYLDRSSTPNNLFHFSEVLLAKALLTLLESKYNKMSLVDLVDELFRVSLWFAQASDALMAAIIDSHGGELRAKDPEEVSFENLRDFRDITLPWFTDTSTAVAYATGSAYP